MTTLRLPTITVDIGESQAPPLPSVDHDIAIVGYYSGNDSLNAVVSPAVGTLSASLHTRAEVQDFIGDTSPAYYAAAAILSHVAPTSIHVLSLGDPAAPVPADVFATHLERLANTSDVHLPDIFLMPGIAGQADGSALDASDLTVGVGATNAYDDDDNVLVAGSATAGDTLYAAMDAYAGSVNGIAILEVPGSTVDNAFAFATENKRQNALLVGNPMKFTGGPADFASPVGPIVGGILERELDPEYGRAAGVDYAPLTGVSELKWQLHHDLTDHTPTNDDTVRLVNNDVTVATRRGNRFDIIGGTVGGYPAGDYRAYLGVLRATQHLQQLMLETNQKFAGRRDDGATLALAQSDFRDAYAPLIPGEFQSITLTPTNFKSDGQLVFEGEVEVYLPVKKTNVTLHLVGAEFQGVAP